MKMLLNWQPFSINTPKNTLSINSPKILILIIDVFSEERYTQSERISHITAYFPSIGNLFSVKEYAAIARNMGIILDSSSLIT